MKMYCWSRPAFFYATAQASSVAEARKLILLEIGPGDGTCPERDEASVWVETTTPAIWMGPNAEFALTDSAELREQEAHSDRLQKRLTAALAACRLASEAIRQLEGSPIEYATAMELVKAKKACEAVSV